MAFFIERSRIYLWRDNENNLLADKEIAEKFKINLSNRNQVLQEVYEDDKILLKDKWQQTRKMWTETCEETVGRRKVKHKDWMSALTLLKIQARKEKKSTLNNCRTRTAKAEAQKEYTVAHQEERRSIRRDKRNHVDRLAIQAEEAAAQGNMRDLYDTTRKLAARYKQADKPIKDKARL